ncbi:MAG: tetratricopeptide repeat protein [Spirochaetales bacterium]|nr:tetratricopeptide repeat protein [Spirochaetales bacterium]
MKNRKSLISALILLLTVLISLPADTPDTVASDSVLKEVDRLTSDGQYLSAWTLLHDRADEVELEDFIIKKTRLALLYYSKTSGHQLFSFDDLKEGETLLDIRQGTDETPDLKLYDPAGALNMILENNPENGEAWKWLGEYYYQVLTIYGDQWAKPASESSALAIEAYEKALSLGMESEAVLARKAYCELMAGEWNGAVEDLKKALAYDESNPEYYYNLGLASLNLQLYADALDYTEKTLGLLNEGPEMANAVFLKSSILLYMQNADGAVTSLIRGMEVSPEDYRFPDRLIRLSLSMEDYDGARAASSRLLDLYPDNPENFRTIVQYFYDFGKLEQLLPFFETVKAVYRGRPEILGNILFHQGLTEFYLEDREASRKSFTEAEAEYARVFPEDHQVFQVINEMKERL